MSDHYVITEGQGGPAAFGPFVSYESAFAARLALRRPWRMFWRRQRYWVQPAELVEAS